MRLIMTIIWAVILSFAITYVLTSMANEPFNVTHTLVVASLIVVGVVALSEGALKEDNS